MKYPVMDALIFEIMLAIWQQAMFQYTYVLISGEIPGWVSLIIIQCAVHAMCASYTKGPGHTLLNYSHIHIDTHGMVH